MDEINQNTTEVSLCSCPAHIPLSFGAHTWFVLNEGWKLSRYEVLFRKNKDTARWYLHINNSWFFDGLEILPLVESWRWKTKVVDSISGEVAQKIIAKIKESPRNYPHLHKYRLIGPNSNTYTQWILDQFPEWRVRLPRNAFWKNY